VNFNGKVRAPQFALHAGDAGFGFYHLDQKRIHLQDLGGAEFRTNATPLAVPFDNFDFRTAHYPFSPFIRVGRLLTD
jgi:hypothetical protein